MFDNICFECSWVIIPMLIISWLLGWLFWWLFNRSKYQARIDDLDGQVTSWKNKANQLEADLTSANYEKEKINKNVASYRSKNADLEIQLRACKEQVAAATAENSLAATPPATDSSSALSLATGIAAGAAGKRSSGLNFAAAFQNDNLQLIEGIGPKIEELLKADGINNWSALAAADPDHLRKVLEAAGSRYRVHDPSTWPKQASLAKDGKWEELETYQAYLGGGKDTGKASGGEAKITKMAAKALGITLYKPNDLKVVEGIGPKIEKLLQDADINDWEQLARTSVDRLKEILNAAGDSYRLADPTTWPKQATMAQLGKWQELKDYQDELLGGRS